jgi:DNA-binding response OmpR family regulator
MLKFAIEPSRGFKFRITRDVLRGKLSSAHRLTFFASSLKPHEILKGFEMSFEDLPNALLVEDDPNDRLQVRLQLELMGFVVYDSPSKLEAQELFGQRDYSIVLIHLGHSPLESMQLCRSIRAESTVPIIMLTQRDEIVDEEMVLSAGADDYVTKPIVDRILTSRITQQVKRGQTQRAPRANILTWGPLELDLSQHSFTIAGKVVMLTNTEYQFLQLLMANPQRIFSREQILSAIGAFRGLKSDHLVDSHASRLRKKIREAGGPELISVVRSVGFRLAPAQA